MLNFKKKNSLKVEIITHVLWLVFSGLMSFRGVQVLCLRDRTREGVRTTDHSLVLDIQLTSMRNLQGGHFDPRENKRECGMWKSGNVENEF